MKQTVIKLIKAASYVVLTIPEMALATIYNERARQTSLNRPIIIVGPDRSGTSLVYSLLANHPDVCALTAVDSMLPAHPFAATTIRKFLSRRSTQNYRSVPDTNARISGGLTAPREAVHYWFHHLGSHQGGWKKAEHDYMTEADLDDVTRQTLPLDLKKRLTLLEKRRLVLKQPGFSLKMRYLDALFPDALFVHCLRHPLDNFRSLLVQKSQNNDSNWGIHIPGWQQYAHCSTEEQTARQLKGTDQLIRESVAYLKLPPGRYLPVRYEALTTQFIPEIKNLFAGCGLEVPADILEHPEHYVRPAGSRKKQPTPPEDPTARDILEKLAVEMGYSAMPA